MGHAMVVNVRAAGKEKKAAQAELSSLSQYLDGVHTAEHKIFQFVIVSFKNVFFTKFVVP
jgi:hypothetical protein